MDDISQDPRVARIIRNALDEDIGTGDVTTLALVDPAAQATGAILTREPCRVAGATIAAAVLKAVDPAAKYTIRIPDGHDAPQGATILTFTGRAASILTAERTALNFMQRLCGIATQTARFVEAVKDYHTLILDTRKTTPGLRLLEKYAVRCGGGTNHRFGLYDRVLMKDNHRRLWRDGDPDRLDLAVEAARAKFPGVMVEIEVENFDELRSALRAKPEWIMLDNMDCPSMAKAVQIVAGASKLEASGGITLERARAVAATGVDAISLGCLTHSVRSIDLSLEWETV
ncbi:MAG: carboxylating nicotinate-nucleotide diphosphorylase [Kiritimatiellia bacterium]